MDVEDPMKASILQFVALLGPLSIVSGCRSMPSESSPEFIRDPLRIEKSINDYYFPTKDPQSTASTELAGQTLPAEPIYPTTGVGMWEPLALSTYVPPVEIRVLPAEEEKAIAVAKEYLHWDEAVSAKAEFSVHKTPNEYVVSVLTSCPGGHCLYLSHEWKVTKVIPGL